MLPLILLYSCCCSAEESARLRLLLERSRLAAVEQRALAHATVVTLATKVEGLSGELSAKQSNLFSTEDNLKLKAMELEGANAQLQVSRKQAVR